MKLRNAVVIIFSLLLLANMSFAVTHNVTPGDDLQAIVAGASSGDDIQLANGTYVLTSTLNITTSNLTIVGESQNGVVLDVSSHSGYGIYTTASQLSLSNFTLLPNPSGTYPVKASFGGTVQNGLVLSNITVVGSKRTAFDIHGIDNVTMSGLTAKNTSSGNGITFTGCTNVTVSGCTTSGNAWGGIAVYCSKPAYANRGSDNITIDFNANNIGETVYVEDEFGLTNTNISVPGATHLIENDYAADAFMHMYTNKGEADALSIGDALNSKYSNTKSTVEELASGDYIVDPNLKIQEAIDAASAGGQVVLKAGTFTEDFALNKHADLMGQGVGDSFINGKITLTGSGNSGDPLTIEDLTINGQNQNADVIEIVAPASVEHVLLQHVKTVGIGNLVGESCGLWVRGNASLKNSTIYKCSFESASYGIYTQKASGGSGVVADVTISGCDFLNNTGKGIYAEKMSDVSISGCSFINNGNIAYWHKDWNAGVDINLKYGSYQNVSVSNNSFNGNGNCSKEGVALTVKARDDGGYGGNPASLDGVTITGNTFESNERSIRIGEPGKNNATPTNVVINNNNFLGTTGCSTGGSPIADVLNYTQSALNADANFWGNADGPTPDQVVENPGTVIVETWLEERDGETPFQNPAKVGVTVWIDEDLNGVIDAGELGVKNVELRLPKGDKVSKHKTNAKGYCHFTNVAPGTYTVTLVQDDLPDGVVSTTGGFSRDVTVTAANNFPQIVFGVAGADFGNKEGKEVVDDPRPTEPTVASNALVFVKGSTSGSVSKAGMDWTNAVDQDTEGFDGTVWAKAEPDSGDTVPFAIFEFGDQGVYAFDYAQFQTDNGTDDNGTKNDAYQVTHIEVLVSTTGMEEADFVSVGTFKRTYGVHKMQWCKLSERTAAKYVKLRLLNPVVDGKWTQIVEFALETGDKTGPVPASETEQFAVVPESTELLTNYPNPFNPVTTVKYAIENAAQVRLTVYDLTGKQVAELVNVYQTPGSYTVQFDAADLPSGMYFCTIQAGSFNQTRRMMLIK